ncbi:MAG: hypothetical protein ABI658_09690 [Acidimicrobiales bacterium]
MHSRRVPGLSAFRGLIALAFVAAACSNGGSSATSPATSVATSTSTSVNATSSIPLATTTSSTTINEQYDSLTALAFDNDAIYGRWTQTSRSRKTDRLVRFDRATGTISFIDAVTSPAAAIRAGRWLFVVAFDLDKPCTDACAGKVMRLDPTTMHIEQSEPIDRVTGGLALVGNTLWVASRQAVMRVAIDTGQILASPLGEFAATETIAGLTATSRPSRVYAVVAQGQDRYALAALDPTSGHVTARGSTIGAGPGGAGISHGDYGLWFSIATGMQGYAIKVDPDTLTRLDVRLDSQARPTVQQGVGVLWVDESWGGFLSCADPATGAILWRKDIQTNTVSFARDTTGRMTPFQGWVPVDAPSACAQG